MWGVEISMFPSTPDGRSGWQFCCLVEINGGKCNTKEEFFKACEVASALCTLQVGYTDFPFMSKETKEITEREALIGVSITGWMNNPEILFDEDNMKKGAEIVKKTNKRVAEMIGVNQSARCTCVKPSGNASVLLETASGIHGDHAAQYLRHVQMNTDSEVAKLFMKEIPEMVEKSVWSSSGTDIVIAFPVQPKQGTIFKKDLLGIKQLEYVKKAQQVWIEHGTNEELCLDKRLRHNVSNTITVDDWDAVTDYVYANKQWFCGISFLAATGDSAYPQAPFTEVKTAEQIISQYGACSMFASGMITRGLEAFGNDLWRACNTALGFGEDLSVESHENAMKRDWVRSFTKFAKTYFSDNKDALATMLKDVYNLHKFEKITKNVRTIDFSKELSAKEFVEVDTLGAQGCAGGTCEIVF